MNIFKTMLVAASGMTAQSERMRVIAENLANANSTADSPDGSPYRRRVAVFANELDRVQAVNLVKMSRTVADKSEFGKRFDPGHPAADAAGYVQTPNVNPIIETMDMRDAQRSYEAGLNVISAARSMLSRTIDLLRG